jgi:hypothetical protein
LIPEDPIEQIMNRAREYNVAPFDVQAARLMFSNRLRLHEHPEDPEALAIEAHFKNSFALAHPNVGFDELLNLQTCAEDCRWCREEQERYEAWREARWAKLPPEHVSDRIVKLKLQRPVASEPPWPLNMREGVDTVMERISLSVAEFDAMSDEELIRRFR